MKIFLILKHWQVFLIWIVGIFQMVFFIKTDLWFLSFVLYAGLFLVWIYSIGNILNKNKKLNKEMNILWILYLLSLIPYAFNFRYMITESHERIDSWIVGPSAIIGVFAIFKIIIHTAKTLKRTETNEELKIADLFNEIFLLFAFFLGIWILQPRINKIVAEKN